MPVSAATAAIFSPERSLANTWVRNVAVSAPDIVPFANRSVIPARDARM